MCCLSWSKHARLQSALGAIDRFWLQRSEKRFYLKQSTNFGFKSVKKFDLKWSFQNVSDSRWRIKYHGQRISASCKISVENSEKKLRHPRCVTDFMKMVPILLHKLLRKRENLHQIADKISFWRCCMTSLPIFSWIGPAPFFSPWSYERFGNV